MGYSCRRGVPEKEGVAEHPVTTLGEEMLLASGHAMAVEPVLLLSTVYTWLPEKLDLLDGMILGAGFGSALGGGFGLILKWRDKTIELEHFVATGTIIGVIAGGLLVAAGNMKII